jgi:uncharacterized protein (TIGR03118 family)
MVFRSSRPRRSPRPAGQRRTVTRLQVEPLEDRSLLSGYQQHNLVGFQPGMAHYTDPLLNGWGLAFAPDGPFWVADTATGVSTVYDHQGKPLPLVVTIPGGLTTGIVYNPTSDFVISQNGKSGPALFIFDSISGIISGWNPAVNPTQAVIMLDNSAKGAHYFDLALGQNSHKQNVLYAANGGNLMGSGAFEMYDGGLHSLGSFTDPAAAASTSPVAFGIKEVNGQLYVTFVNFFSLGPWGGVVDVFDIDGHYLRRFAANDLGKGPLANPWAVVQAPANFGIYSNDILIGNIEQNTGPAAASINAFDPRTGTFLGQLKQPDGTPLAIPGLWDLDFGAGSRNNGKTNELFFTAGPNAINFAGNGLFGMIHAAGEGEGPGGNASLPAGSKGSPSAAPLVSLSLETGPMDASAASSLNTLSPAAWDGSIALEAPQIAPTPVPQLTSPSGSADLQIIRTANPGRIEEAIGPIFAASVAGQEKGVLLFCVRGVCLPATGQPLDADS